MVLDVVYYHGCYRSLNNRHLDAHKQAQESMRLVWMQRKSVVRIRVWPLSPGLLIQGRDVVDKFMMLTLQQTTDEVFQEVDMAIGA